MFVLLLKHRPQRLTVNLLSAFALTNFGVKNENRKRLLPLSHINTFTR
jgi:hypothetical protein